MTCITQKLDEGNIMIHMATKTLEATKPLGNEKVKKKKKKNLILPITIMPMR